MTDMEQYIQLILTTNQDFNKVKLTDKWYVLTNSNMGPVVAHFNFEGKILSIKPAH